MNNNLNSLTLEQLVTLSQQIGYVEPKSEFDKWTEDEIIFKAINLAINNFIQVKALIIGCKLFPPVKLIAKSILRRYIDYYVKLGS